MHRTIFFDLRRLKFAIGIASKYFFQVPQVSEYRDLWHPPYVLRLIRLAPKVSRNFGKLIKRLVDFGFLSGDVLGVRTQASNISFPAPKLAGVPPHYDSGKQPVAVAFIKLADSFANVIHDPFYQIIRRIKR